MYILNVNYVKWEHSFMHYSVYIRIPSALLVKIAH